MRVLRGTQPPPAAPSSPDGPTPGLRGHTLDAEHHQDAARRSDITGDVRAGGQHGAAHGDPEGDLEAALDLARAGDERGFATLWRTLHPPLLRYLTVRGNPAPEDIASETWLQVVRDLSGFRGGAMDFRAWLFTVARHRAIDQGRARTARPVVPVADPVADSPAAEGRAPSAEDDAAEREATAGALRMVATLPPDQAELVMLRVVAGLDVAAVARLVGKKPGTVRVAVHRALRSLSNDPRIRAEARGGVT
jgi:RNA polymerase sigma-70 factor (ECF subfamily)